MSKGRNYHEGKIKYGIIKIRSDLEEIEVIYLEANIFVVNLKSID